MSGWIAAAVLYVLGALVTTATPQARKERGGFLLFLLVIWPLAAFIGLLSVPGALLWRKEIERGGGLRRG